MKINENYLNLEDSYLFVRIGQKVAQYKEKRPDADIIRLGIGDVTLPLAPAVVTAMEKATKEMGCAETFRGYEDNNGYSFLKQAIIGYYANKGVTLSEEEIFVSDGAKSDVGNILDLFSADNTVLIPDPVYPVYVDTNIMAGRKIIYAKGCEENGFLPLPEDTPAGGEKPDIIYMCSPNNPTGAVYTKEQLGRWVEYAAKNDAVILFDSAYEAFVQAPAFENANGSRSEALHSPNGSRSETMPTSIFQVSGARQCAIEFCSLSKTAGFTGTRCGYTIVPSDLARGGASINKLWKRRQNTKFNGVAYIVQRGAEAVFSAEGMSQCKENIASYMKNAETIADTLKELGIWHTGGRNSPYIWLKCPDGKNSWAFFDHLLEKANVVGTPGSGFGKNGEDFFRLTAFGSSSNVTEAMRRLKAIL